MFLTWVREKGLTPETGEDLSTAMAQYVTEHRTQWKPKTVQRKLTALRAFGRHHGADVLMRYRAPSPPRAVPHPLPEGVSGVLAMIEAADTPQRAALITLLGLAGLRIHEALDVYPDDFDLADRTLYVRGKGDKARVVPVSDAAWVHLVAAYTDAILRQVKAEGAKKCPLVGLTDRRARQVVTDIGKKAGISRPVSSHDLRATFATAAYSKTRDIRAVQDLLGHSNSKTTEIYTGVAESAMREASEIVED